MDATLRIHESTLQFTDETLERLNKVLLDMPVCDAYNNNKVKDGKRIRLKPVMKVTTEEITI